MRPGPGSALAPPAPTTAALLARFQELDRRLADAFAREAEARRLCKEAPERTRAILSDLRRLADEGLLDCTPQRDAMAYLVERHHLRRSQAAKYLRVAEHATDRMLEALPGIEVGAVLCARFDGQEPLPAAARDLLLEAHLRHQLNRGLLGALWRRAAGRLAAGPGDLEAHIDGDCREVRAEAVLRRGERLAAQLKEIARRALSLEDDPEHGPRAKALRSEVGELALGLRGERRHVPREAEAEAAEAAPAAQIPAAGIPAAEAAPAAQIPAAGIPAAEAAPAADIPVAGTSAMPAAPRPERWAACQVDLPVAYPAGDPDVTEAERLCGALIVALTTCTAVAAAVRARYAQGLDELAFDLAKLVLEEAHGTRQVLEALDARLGGALASAPVPEWPPPLSLDQDAAARRPMAWVSYEVRDPFDDPDPTELERRLFPLLGLCAYLRRAATDLCARADAGDACAYDLIAQLRGALAPCSSDLIRVCALMHSLRHKHAAEIQRLEAQEAVFEQLRQQAALRVVVLGERQPPPQYTIVGHLEDGRPVAISQNTPQLVIILGAQGTGKSHLGMLLQDGIICLDRALGPMVQPPRIIRLASDWRQGSSGDELRAGFYPNPRAAAWESLRRDLGVTRRGTSIRGAYLLCLPESVEKFRGKLADLVERGLVIEPLRLHPTELGQFGYALLLSGGSEGGSTKPAYRALIESIIGWHGADATPALLRRELGKARIDARAEGALQLQLKRLETVVSPEHHLIDKLERGWPLQIYLESRYWGQDQILPLQVAAMNALSRPLRSGADPARWIFQEEMNIALASEAAGPFYLELGTNLRHRPTWLFACAQRARDLPVGWRGWRRWSGSAIQAAWRSSGGRRSSSACCTG